MLICEYSATCYDLSIFGFFFAIFDWFSVKNHIKFFSPYELNMGNMGNPHIKGACVSIKLVTISNNNEELIHKTIAILI